MIRYIILLLFSRLIPCNAKINCYNCTGHACKPPIHALPVTTCPKQCCYSVTTEDKHVITNTRGCAAEATDCNKLCAQYHKNKHLRYCRSCSRNLCNSHKLTETIRCYQCAHCNAVTKTTNVINCDATDGCYLNKDGLTVTRGCINVCTLDTCISCDTDKCNSDEFNKTKPFKQIKTKSIKCAECTHCNAVTNATTRVTCDVAACCYEAVVNDFPMGGLYAVRGCGKGNCEYKCVVFERDHLKTNIGGSMEFCVACSEDDCNIHEYKAVPDEIQLRN